MTSSSVLSRLRTVFPVVRLLGSFRGYSYTSLSNDCQAQPQDAGYYVHFLSYDSILAVSDRDFVSPPFSSYDANSWNIRMYIPVGDSLRVSSDVSVGTDELAISSIYQLKLAPRLLNYYNKEKNQRYHYIRWDIINISIAKTSS